MLDTKPSSQSENLGLRHTAVELAILDERLDEVPTVQELTTIQSEVLAIALGRNATITLRRLMCLKSVVAKEQYEMKIPI